MDIPGTAEDITAQWMTKALRQSGSLGEGRVASVQFEPIGVGLGFAAVVERATVMYSGDAGSAPETLVAKLPSQHTRTRELLTEIGGYEREARFYLELAKEVGIPVPELYYGDSDAVTGSFVLLMEDLSTARAGDQVNGCSVDDARTVVQNSAVMHARWWNSDRLGQLPWLSRTTDPVWAATAQTLYMQSWSRISDYLRTLFPVELYEIAERLGPKIVEVFAGAAPHALTLNHGDCRLGNLFFRDGEVVSIDWQGVNQGRPAADVAYFLMWSLPIEQRRSHEKALLDSYHEVLMNQGIRDYSRDHLIEDYRRGMFGNLTIAVRALANLDMDSEGGRAVVDALAPRLVAIVDWDCGALIPD